MPRDQVETRVHVSGTADDQLGAVAVKVGSAARIPDARFLVSPTYASLGEGITSTPAELGFSAHNKLRGSPIPPPYRLYAVQVNTSEPLIDAVELNVVRAALNHIPSCCSNRYCT